MEDVNGHTLSRLPTEMLRFVLRHLDTSQVGPRVGQLVKAGRTPIETPHYVASTSRGVVPHLAHDTLQRHTSISAVYIGLEDFIEKSQQDAPIFNTPTTPAESLLSKYIALPDQCVSILGARRVPSVPCPAQNTNSSISVSTSVGFRYLDSQRYIEATKQLAPDISVSLADVISADKISVKRVEKSADRTHAWLRDTLEANRDKTESSPAIAASIPPIEKEQQSFYLSDLCEDFGSSLSGLCLYSPSTPGAIPVELNPFLKICLSNPDSPHALLSAISVGVDLITTSFITQNSEHGIAFTFSFPPPAETSQANPEPLGFDLWSANHSTSLTPLTPDCPCYTCTRHHQAYIHHLLQAKEMLAWTLLQVHNFAVLDRFFANIRTSIRKGTFAVDADRFHRFYELELPGHSGEGPRIRGYQMRSVGGGEPRRNPKAYGKLDEQIQKLQKADDGLARPEDEVDAMELVESGFAEKQTDSR